MQTPVKKPAQRASQLVFRFITDSASVHDSRQANCRARAALSVIGAGPICLSDII